MGGCATKPRELESDAPLAVEDDTKAAPPAAEAEEKEGLVMEPQHEKDKVAAVPVNGEESRRQSLGVLLKDNEETEKQSEVEKKVEVETVKEVKEIAEEQKMEDQEPKEESESTITSIRDEMEQKTPDPETSSVLDKEVMNSESEAAVASEQ